MSNLININKVFGKAYVGILKFIGRFNMPWYLDRYVKWLRYHGMDIQGNPQYIATTAHFDGGSFSRIHIGDKTVISGEVEFICHDYSISRALEALGEDMTLEAYFQRDIRVGSNCFIGFRSVLLPGASIGDNCIVGAGSVVRGKVEDNSIIAGNPAVPIGNTLEWGCRHLEKSDYKRNVCRTH